MNCYMITLNRRGCFTLNGFTKLKEEAQEHDKKKKHWDNVSPRAMRVCKIISSFLLHLHTS